MVYLSLGYPSLDWCKSPKILFFIPTIVTIHGRTFKIETKVTETHENVDLVLGVKIFIEFEAQLRMRDLKFRFLNRSIPVNKEMVKPKKRIFMKVEAPF